jgi:hypothetical protein
MRKQSLFIASLLTGFLAPVFPSMSDEIVNVEQGWSPADNDKPGNAAFAIELAAGA